MSNKHSTTGFISVLNLFTKLFTTCITGILFSIAIPTSAEGLETEKAISIQSQPLYSALTEFAGQSGVQFVYDAALVKGLSSQGTRHAHNKNQALSGLLKNSGLNYRFTGPDTVVLYRHQGQAIINDANSDYLLPVVQVTADGTKAIGDGQVMPKVTVEADAESDYDPEYYTDPCNKDWIPASIRLNNQSLGIF
jgi:hypothetical protein